MISTFPLPFHFRHKLRYGLWMNSLISHGGMHTEKFYCHYNVGVYFFNINFCIVNYWYRAQITCDETRNGRKKRKIKKKFKIQSFATLCFCNFLFAAHTKLDYIKKWGKIFQKTFFTERDNTEKFSFLSLESLFNFYDCA